MRLDIYTDGSCRNNGAENAVGAWGYIILDENGMKIREYGEVVKGTTNQRMELQAVLAGCAWGYASIRRAFDEVHIYTDSAYIHNCREQKWYDNWQNNGWINSKKEPVANKDLWVDLLPFFKDVRFNFTKVSGHQNGETTHSYWNNYIDNKVQTLSAEAINV